MLHHFIEQSKLFFEELGSLGLFLLAFIESSFFIIPPDTLLIGLILINPASALFLAFICTIGSTIGGIFGYYIGVWGGRPLLNRFVKPEKIQKVNNLYDKYGVWAVAIAGFSPIPYKVFTISSGVFKLQLFPFILSSFLSRGARFFLVAIAIMLFGKTIIANIDKFILIITGFSIITGALYFFYKKGVFKKKELTPSRKIEQIF